MALIDGKITGWSTGSGTRSPMKNTFIAPAAQRGDVVLGGDDGLGEIGPQGVDVGHSGLQEALMRGILRQSGRAATRPWSALSAQSLALIMSRRFHLNPGLEPVPDGPNQFARRTF